MEFAQVIDPSCCAFGVALRRHAFFSRFILASTGSVSVLDGNFLENHRGAAAEDKAEKASQTRRQSKNHLTGKKKHPGGTDKCGQRGQSGQSWKAKRGRERRKEQQRTPGTAQKSRTTEETNTKGDKRNKIEDPPRPPETRIQVSWRQKTHDPLYTRVNESHRGWVSCVLGIDLKNR